jgi:hypothetical protein
MRGLQAIVANGSGGSEAGMNDRSPALQAAMLVAMKQVRRPDGNRRAARLDCGERRMLVHDVVGQQDLLKAAAPHVERRGIVESARSADQRKQHDVLAIPEAMPGIAWSTGGGRTGDRPGLRGSLPGSAGAGKKHMRFPAGPPGCGGCGRLRQVVAVIGPAHRARKASSYPCDHQAKTQDGILPPVLHRDFASIIAFSRSSAPASDLPHSPPAEAFLIAPS